jgi:hypothetical protein
MQCIVIYRWIVYNYTHFRHDWTEQWTTEESWFDSQPEMFLFSTAFRSTQGPIQSPIQWISEALLSWYYGRRVKLTANLYSAEVTNGGTLPPLFQVSTHGVVLKQSSKLVTSVTHAQVDVRAAWDWYCNLRTRLKSKSEHSGFWRDIKAPRRPCRRFRRW